MDAAPAGTVAGQGITEEELRLAARNHALPLEALRYDITPAGLHYLLIHYDIPDVDPATFRLEIGGAVERPVSLSLDDLRGRERIAEPITFECAGNGRALLESRPEANRELHAPHEPRLHARVLRPAKSRGMAASDSQVAS